MSEEIEIVRLKVIIHGRVQGVGFRYFTQSQARNLHLVGWCRNLPNGDVVVEAEGEKTKIEKLLAALKKGPALSRVDHIDSYPLGVNGQEANFNIT